ncbi:unnamed protein product, partial [Timema podura]|nr:unnamed protein product [Timema podura]
MYEAIEISHVDNPQQPVWSPDNIKRWYKACIRVAAMFQRVPVRQSCSMKVLSILALGVFLLAGTLLVRGAHSVGSSQNYGTEKFHPAPLRNAVCVLIAHSLSHVDDSLPICNSEFPFTQEVFSGKRAVAPESEGDVSLKNPLNPFLSIKPFLPSKPTFIPPVVDPNYFIGQKTALLNNLFPDKPAAVGPDIFLDKKTAFLNQLFNQLSAAPGTAASKRALVAPPTTNPFADKKTEFLNQLFNSLNLPTPTSDDAEVEDEVVTTKPTIVPPGFWSPFIPLSEGDVAASSPIVKPTIVPPSFWSPFIPLSAPTAKPTIVPPGFWSPFALPSPVKPTIVPPSFWSPFAPSSALKPSFVSPFAPPSLTVDPSVFIDKKTAFLNKLFESLNVTATPAPVETDPALIYSQKLSEFLDKLFGSLAPQGTNDTSSAQKREVESPKEVAGLDSVLDVVDDVEDDLSRRSSSPAVTLDTTLLDAKDNIVSTIISEMVGIKNSMLDTVADIIKKQKDLSAEVAGGFGPGKKPFASPYAAMWAPTPKPSKPTPDPLEPFKQKIDLLSQQFDTLSKVQQDVTAAVNRAQVRRPAFMRYRVKAPPPSLVLPVFTLQESTTSDPRLTCVHLAGKHHLRPSSYLCITLQESTTSVPTPAPLHSDASLLDLILSKLDSYNNSTPTGKKPVRTKTSRGVPEDESSRQLRDLLSRSIKMAVHQGYQSLPPGSEEILQAGGGGSPDTQEGGGLRLQSYHHPALTLAQPSVEGLKLAKGAQRNPRLRGCQTARRVGGGKQPSPPQPLLSHRHKCNNNNFSKEATAVLQLNKRYISPIRIE